MRTQVDVVTQPIQKETICIKVDSNEKVLSNNDTVTLIPHKESYELHSDQEYKLIRYDYIVVINRNLNGKRHQLLILFYKIFNEISVPFLL